MRLIELISQIQCSVRSLKLISQTRTVKKCLNGCYGNVPGTTLHLSVTQLPNSRQMTQNLCRAVKPIICDEFTTNRISMSYHEYPRSKNCSMQRIGLQSSQSSQLFKAKGMTTLNMTVLNERKFKRPGFWCTLRFGFSQSQIGEVCYFVLAARVCRINWDSNSRPLSHENSIKPQLVKIKIFWAQVTNKTLMSNIIQLDPLFFLLSKNQQI